MPRRVDKVARRTQPLRQLSQLQLVAVPSLSRFGLTDSVTYNLSLLLQDFPVSVTACTMEADQPPQPEFEGEGLKVWVTAGH